MSMRSDDLPEPEGPTSPSVSPRSTSRVIPFRISTRPAFPSSERAAFFIERTASVIVGGLSGWGSLAYGAARTILKLCATLGLSAGVAAAEPVTILALGDSLTQGYGLAPSDGFVPQMSRWLEEQGAEVELRNAGVSGDTTAGGLARAEWSLDETVDGMIVALGGNDLLRGVDPASSRTNLEGILEVSPWSGNCPVLLLRRQWRRRRNIRRGVSKTRTFAREL